MSTFLTDGIISLRPIARADLPQLAAWRNDPELRARTRELGPLTEEDQARWFARITAPETRDFMFGLVRVAAATKCGIASLLGSGLARHDFAIGEDRCDCLAMGRREQGLPAIVDRLIGVVGLCHLVPRDRVAEISFYVGPPEMRGRSYARRALQLLHQWGFDELNLRRVYAETYDFNAPSLRLLERLGYREEGRLRGHVWRFGRPVDSVMLGLLRDEWVEQRERTSEPSTADAASAARTATAATSG